jgi:2-methylcitrate dehydratase PrpD
MRQTQLEIAADWISSFRYEDIPSGVLDLARHQVANILAALFAGSQSVAGMKAHKAFDHTRSRGPCTLIPHGDKVSLFDALYLHSIYANALELDDFLYRGHLGQAVVLVPLAMCEAFGLSGRDFLTAQVAANEIGGRLGASITADILHGHQRSYLQRLSAAVCVSKLLSLNREKTAQALSIALSQPEYALHPAMFSPETKVLSAASSVVEGVRAGFLADEGMKGAKDILEHRAGFFSQFTLHRKPPEPFVQLGDAWVTEAISFKRYSSCAYAAGTVHAVRSILEQEQIDPDTIKDIEIATTAPAIILEQLAEPHYQGQYTPVNVQFSIARSALMALHYGDIRGYHYSQRNFARAIPFIQMLAPKTRVVHDWYLTLQLLRGIDDGLIAGGSESSAGMVEFYRASREYKKKFGRTQSIHFKDIPKLLALSGPDKRYFIGRFMRGFKSKIVAGQKGRPFGDFSKLSWRMASRVVIHLKTGAFLESTSIIPPGMAGDPNRMQVVKEKLAMEGSAVIGKINAQALYKNIVNLENCSVRKIISATVNKNRNRADDDI